LSRLLILTIAIAGETADTAWEATPEVATPAPGAGGDAVDTPPVAVLCGGGGSAYTLNAPLLASFLDFQPMLVENETLPTITNP